MLSEACKIKYIETLPMKKIDLIFNFQEIVSF
jgi:hypothetical protein